ncbi:murein L,D-transpeptidase [Roseomonas sp. CCTCC AB2023176]|uniref:L,D-transpeptidase family protein n=1 Tax=Roseomonas sp. CCTCC AB2023176 TaxID=3342640 RepID=UPI0035DB2389
MRRRDVLTGLAAASLPAAAPAATAPPAAALSWDAVLRLAARLRRLPEDGLDPAAYGTPPEGLATTDRAAFHQATYHAAHAALVDLVLGRVRAIGGRPDIQRDPARADFPRWAAELAAAAEPAAVLDRAADLPEGAALLRAELAKANALVLRGGWPAIPGGVHTLEPGMTDAGRIQALRARLRAEDPILAAAPDGGAGYDGPLVEAVKRWQAARGLEADGRVGPVSQAMLNVPASGRVAQLRAALDLRRNPAPLPEERRIDVNVPDFSLAVMDGSRVVLRMAVVVGKPARATPMLRVRMTAVQFNPTWGVPERNAREDLLPRFRANPRAMQERGFKLYGLVNGERVEVDPTTVDWSGVSRERFPYFVRQDAGDGNALGRIKFIMPNGDDIYMHDTPDRHLFRRPDRAFSSGCIRLENPLGLLDVLAEGMGWDRARVQRTLDSRQTSGFALRRSFPVRLHYNSVVVENGAVRIRPDIYGLDLAYVREMDRPRPQVVAGRVA